MILTLTPNPALDRTWRVEELVPGESHRVRTGTLRAGGKGLNVSRVLHALGRPTLAITTAGGTNGQLLAADLLAGGIPHRLVAVQSPTRESIAVVDGGARSTLFNEYGGPLTEREWEQVLQLTAELASTAEVVVVSGSLPPEAPADLWIRLARIVGRTDRLVIDTSGPALTAAATIGPALLKPNREELAAATGNPDPEGGARDLIARGARTVAVSLGTEGVLLVPAGAASIRARLPEVLHGNATGAGDAMVAALADGLHVGLEPTQLLRQAVAWSAAAVLMPVAGEISPRWPDLAAAVVIDTADGPS